LSTLLLSAEVEVVYNTSLFPMAALCVVDVHGFYHRFGGN
jgi:hypothetical protein